MMSRYKTDDDERYEQGYYDDYQEEEEVEEKEEEEEEEEVPTKEEQDFLKLREELKEKFRKQLKQQTNSGSKSQVKKERIKSDSFGSFFGPSKPVIASRVLDESRSIRETQHILSKNAKSSSNHVKDYSSSDKKITVSKPQPVVNEVKRKAQTLKDMRDYSFLLSDDADIPDAKEEPKQPIRKPSIPDARSIQAQIRSKQQLSKPTRPIPNGNVLKNPISRNPQSQTRMAPANGTPLHKPRPITAPKRPDEPRNGSSRPLVQKRVIQSKPSSQPMVSNRPQANSSKMIPMRNKPAPVVSHSSAQKNRMPEHQPKRPIQSVNNRLMVSSKSQPPKNIPPQHRREERVVSKQPMKRRLDDDDDDEGEAAISMIRQMFKYNPRKYADDDDISDMEADFHEIEREEKRSAKIARMEDEEQARLIEEEERRERMRKKQKLKRG